MKSTLLLALLLPCILCAQNIYPFKNLVLEGGGVRGLAYSGALEVLEQRKVLQNIENVAGSSAGAIAGLMVALDYSSSEIDSILKDLKIQEFNDGKFFYGKIRRLKNKYGLYKGDKIDEWIGQLIQKKTGDANTTFDDLHELHLQNKNFKNFYCTGTNITQQNLEVFSWKHWPNMKLRTAVRISSSIPFYFIPVAIDSSGYEISLEDTSSNFDLFVDGGMLCNYPINIFDSCINGGNPLQCDNLIYNPQTIGLKLERGRQIEKFKQNNFGIAPFKIETMKQYSIAVMNLMMESLNRKSNQLDNEKGRTIFISYGDISGKLRKISSKEKKQLHDNGVSAANKYFEEYASSK